MTAVTSDLDGDGWPDIYVASDSTAAILYRNNRDGTLTDVAVESGAAYSENGNAQAGMGVAVGDYNDDGLLDILKTHFADDMPSLYRNLGKGLFEDVASAAGLAVENRHVEWGVGMPDLDNDGLPDLFYVTGNVYPEIERVLPQYPRKSPRLVFRNTGRGAFEHVTARSGEAAAAHSSRGAAFGDIDNDGDIDVLVMNMNEPPSLLRNDYSGANGWIDVELQGTRSNRSAIGATVVVSAGGVRQARAVLSQSSYYSHDDFRLHFGLGDERKIDRIEVRWPAGGTETLTNVEARRVLAIKEGSGR
jgi:enediyne biosynthesis protein E4